MINKLLTGSLWCSKMSILDMNEVYTSMWDQFKVWSEDASSFLEGETVLFDDTTIKHGESWRLPHGKLQQCCCAGASSSPLQILLYPLWTSSGGSPSWGSSWQTNWEPKPNTVSEWDFAQLDRFLREKPNATTVALESLILLATTRQENGCSKKSYEQKAKIFTSARKMAPKLRKQYQARRKAIQQHRVEFIESKSWTWSQKKKERVATNRIDEISMVGLWQTEEVHSEISSVKAVKQKLHAETTDQLQKVCLATGVWRSFSFQIQQKQEAIPSVSIIGKPYQVG